MPHSMWMPWFTSWGCKMAPHLQLMLWKVPVEWKRGSLPPVMSLVLSSLAGHCVHGWRTAWERECSVRCGRFHVTYPPSERDGETWVFKGSEDVVPKEGVADAGWSKNNKCWLQYRWYFMFSTSWSFCNFAFIVKCNSTLYFIILGREWDKLFSCVCEANIKMPFFFGLY